MAALDPGSQDGGRGQKRPSRWRGPGDGAKIAAIPNPGSQTTRTFPGQIAPALFGQASHSTLAFSPATYRSGQDPVRRGRGSWTLRLASNWRGARLDSISG